MRNDRLSSFFSVITNYQRVFAVGMPGNPISRYQCAHVPVTRLACLCAVRHARINSVYRHKAIPRRFDFANRFQMNPSFSLCRRTLRYCALWNNEKW